MASIVCGHCGATNPEGRQFCENCDGFLDWEGKPTEADTPAPAPTRPAAGSASASTAPIPPAAPTAVQTPAATPPPATTQQAEQRSATPLIPSPAGPAPTGPPQGTCPRCGTLNAATRRFCGHCGEWLVVPSAVSAGREGPRGRRRRWWQRREAYTSSLTPSTIFFRVFAAVAAVVVLAVILTLANLHPIQRVTDFVGHVRGSGRVDGVTAAAQPADAISGHTAPWAVDNQRDRGWTTRWTASGAGNPSAACSSAAAQAGTTSSSATANTLVLTFREPVDIREIGIEAGSTGDDERSGRWQPKTLELRWSGGQCQRVDLADVADLQRFGVHQGTVRSVTLAVVAGYPPPNAGSDRLDIGEVTFWQR
jgi:hypothetical protein